MSFIIKNSDGSTLLWIGKLFYKKINKTRNDLFWLNNLTKEEIYLGTINQEKQYNNSSLKIIKTTETVYEFTWNSIGVKQLIGIKEMSIGVYKLGNDLYTYASYSKFPTIKFFKGELQKVFEKYYKQ